MCSHWTEAQLFKFLRLYKRYECLWNPYSPEYGSSDAKSKAFSQILPEMNIFGLTVNECLNQIKHIRATYKQEQQRLENIAFLGGSSFSNLLWYPLMNSMLSKVIQDEEKLNQPTGNQGLVMAPKCLPFNSGDQPSQGDLNQNGYGQRTFPWNPNETSMMNPLYFPNSNYAEYKNLYSDSNIFNNSVGMGPLNKHIGCCPTCGYATGSSCNCFSMDNVGYRPDYNGQSYSSSQSEFNYRPRTSYNYRNGMLEINSAVRIPVSQASPNYGYSNLIESIMPEESEYNLNKISCNHQPEMQNVKQEEEFLMKYCSKSRDCNDKKNKGNDEYKFQKIVNHAPDNNCNPLYMSVNKHGAPTKNTSWSLKKSKKTNGNVDEAQNLLGSTDGAQNLICKSIKHENRVASNIKSLQSMDQENRTNVALQNSPGVEFKKLCNIEEEIVMLNPPQQDNVNIKAEKVPKSEISMSEADVKVEPTSNVVSENEQLMKKNTATKTLQVKQQCDEGLVLIANRSEYKNLQTNCELNSPGLGKRKTRGASKQQGLPAVISDCNERISDTETTQGVMHKSKGIVKNNSTKMVTNFIDETVNKSNERSTVDAGEKLIPKKQAKDLQTTGNERNCDCNDKLASEDYQQSQQNNKIKVYKKTICWREPIEESLDIVPCKFIKNRVNRTNYEENVPAERPMQSNKGIVHCFRMMAGADFDIDNDMNQSNLFRSIDTGLKSKATIISPNCKEHLVIAINKEQQHNDENRNDIVADILNNKESQTNPEEYVLDEIRSVRNSEVAKHEKVELVSRNDIKGKENPIMIDKVCQAEESLDLDSKNMEVDEQMITMESNLNIESCESQMDNLECSNSCSTSQGTMEIDNSVTMKISVKTSESTENEIIDKVVNKITYVLRKTLDKNGYAIEKKHFFKQKNLITNDSGEINRKLIENEAIWKTELKDIVCHLMKHKNSGDSITFKVKTMILPVTNQSDVTEDEATNLNLSPKTRQKLVRSVEGPDEIGSKTCDEQLKGLDSDVITHKSNRVLHFKKQFIKNQTRRCSRKKNHIISNCTLKDETHAADEMLMNDTNRTVISYEDDPHALWKLLKYLMKFRNKFQSIPKKYEKLLRNELRRNKYAIINDTKFEQNHHRNDFVAASFLDKLPSHLNKDINVYLCTEISQEDQTPLTKKIGSDKYSQSNVLNDVNENSFSTGTTIQENSRMKSIKNNSIQKSEIKSEQNVSEWESFSESDEEVSEIVKHYQHQNKLYSKISNRQSNKITSAERYGLDTSHEQLDLRAYASHKTAMKNTFWDQNRAKQVELLDTTIQPINKEYLKPLEANGFKNIPSLRNRCKIIDIFSSNNQNIERTELQSSEEGSMASLCCTEFEESEKETKDRMRTNLSKSVGQSVLEANIKKAVDNHIESCCTEDKTHSMCAPICDVTSRLRLCAIMKLENESSTANRDILSNHICCCDELDKLRADEVFPKPPITTSRKNVMIGNESVRLTTARCQTRPLKRDLGILDQSHASGQDCKKNSNSSLQVTRSETCVMNSATEDTNVKRAIVQSNTQNSVLTSLDIAAFEEESLILEIKMLQPLFAIELKKGHRPRTTEATVEQNSREFLEHKNHDIKISADKKSVIETSLKNSVISPQQESINCINKTTSTSSIYCTVEKMMDQVVELLTQKNEDETFSCGTQTSQVCEIQNDSERRMKAFSDRSTASTSIALNKIKKNAATNCKEKCDCLDPDQCNILLEMLRSLKNYQNRCEISTNEVLLKNPKAYSEKAIPHQKENPSNELTESITLKTLISTVETSLPHIIDPIIYEKLTDTINYIRDQEQNRNYSFKESYPQNRACGTSKRTLEKCKIESEHIRPQSLLLTSDDSQCQKPCKSQTLLTTNSSKNVEEILQDGNMSLQIEGVAHNAQRKIESPTEHRSTKQEVAEQISKHERNELQGNSRLMNTTNYSSIEISGDIEERESACSSYGPNTNKTVNMTRRSEDDENDEFVKYYCCHQESTAVDINAFASMVATQLRGLSTEAALRSQQRIQTLISNSRLESEKNRKCR